MHTDPSMTWAALVPFMAAFVIPVAVGLTVLVVEFLRELVK